MAVLSLGSKPSEAITPGNAPRSDPGAAVERVSHFSIFINALFTAMFLALTGYALASYSNPEVENPLGFASFIIAAIGLMYFVPKLTISTIRFIDQSSRRNPPFLTPQRKGPAYRPLLDEEHADSVLEAEGNDPSSLSIGTL